ncbi:MAG: hypothetical protein ACK4V6_01160 [Microthrixaceae bacterium]
MAVTEESRYQLFQRLEELLGPEKVSTLMELLPPVGWADVATKRDLDHLQTMLEARIERLGTELRGELRAEMFREQRNQTLAIIGANTTITALLLAAFQLL